MRTLLQHRVLLQLASQCLLLLAVSCSGPKPRVEAGPLVESAAQVEAACADSDWRAARLCTDDECRAEALTPSCIACVAKLTDETCTSCLGEAYCAHPDNLEHATSALERTSPTLENVRVHRVGKFPIGGLEGASRGGDEVVVVAVGGLLGQARNSAAVVSEMKQVTAPGRSSVLTAEDQLLWQIPGSLEDCATPTVSPMGRWVATVCGANVRVYELATGFLRHDLVLDAPIDVLGLLGLSNLSALYHCFGGDKHLVLPLAAGWSKIDLDSGRVTKVTLPPSDAIAAKMGAFRIDDDEVRVALSWDGSHIAVGNVRSNGIEIGVFATDGTSHRLITLPSRLEDFAFDGSQKLLVDESDGFSRYDLAGVRLEESAHLDTSEQIAAGRTWWVRTVESFGASVWRPFGRKPLALSPAPIGTRRDFEPPRGLLAMDTVVGLEDGGFVGGSPLFGVTFFDADGSVRPDSLGRGEPLWLTMLGRSELVIAHDDGVRVFDLETSASRVLEIPAEFAQVAPRFADDWIIATGMTERPFLGLQRDDRLWVRLPNGTQRRLTADSDVQSMAIIGSKLFVATTAGISTYDVAAEEPKARPAHQFSNPLDLVKGETAQFSSDGKHALVLEDGRAKLYETTDFTRAVDSFPASSCAFSTQGPTLACLTVAKDRSVKLYSYDLNHRTEISTHSADSNAATALAILRVMDVTADGRQIVLGRGDEWIAVADMDSKRLLSRRGKRAAFVGDEVASTDGVYLYIEKLTETAASEPLPD